MTAGIRRRNRDGFNPGNAGFRVGMRSRGCVDLNGGCPHFRAQMYYDITKLLQSWPYQPGEIMARRIRGRDKTDKIQLRMDMGIMQMNVEGRPDGKRPMGHETWLEAMRVRFQRAEQAGEEPVLSPEDLARLQQECIQFHHRYVCLFQLGDFDGVERDCAHNIAVFEFVWDYAPADEVAWAVLVFGPQLYMMRTRARANRVGREKSAEYLRTIEEGIESIEAFLTRYERPQLADSLPELVSLRRWLAQETERRPKTEVEVLELKLAEAIRLEDYELAARVRDQLRRLGKDS